MSIFIIIAKIICGIFILATLFIMLATMAGSKKAEKITKKVNNEGKKISKIYSISLIAAFAIVFIIP